MKYVAIDIETTGLDPEKHQILEFAAIYDNLECPTPLHKCNYFVRRIWWPDYVISPYCVLLHQELIKEISNNVHLTLPISKLASEFRGWLTSVGLGVGYTVAGKNFANFDARFLERLPGFPKWDYKILDIGSLFATRAGIPSLGKITGQALEHRAYDDALAVVKAVRYALGGNNG